jgi:hypothetical protein
MSDRDSAEEAKKNIIPPLIEVLEEEIEDSIERSWYAEMPDKTESRARLLLRAQLAAAKKDAEWKIQSFKIIDALTQRVAALEARLEAKDTVPLGTPVLGSVPDSCEGAEEPVRRTLFPYW